MKNLTNLFVMAAPCPFRRQRKRFLSRLFALSFTLIFLSFSAFSQSKTRFRISGDVVAGDNQKPLFGASVVIDGEKAIHTTDLEGHFQFSSDKEHITLIVSFIGYQTRKFDYNIGQTPIIVALDPELTKLNEVVVSNGFQSLPKERSTGSFFLADSAIINRRVSSDILSRLEGAVPGLIFNHNTSASNGDVPDINIRGHSTLFANDQPLIIVDNFPYDGNLNDLNPNDVANISVLKDAAAASIWGVRSGNGVIVITTKKGRRDQPLQVELNANVVVGSKPNVKYDPNYLNANDFINVEQSLFTQGYYDNAISSGYQVISPVVQLLANEKAGSISADAANSQINALRRNDVRNDISKYFYRKSTTQQYSLSFKGGGTKSDYYSSVGFDKNLSNLVGNENQRLTLSNNLNVYPIKNLQISAGWFFIKDNGTSNNTLGSLNSISQYSRIYPYAQLADAKQNPLPVVHDLPFSYIASLSNTKFLDWYYRPLDELHNADNTTKSIDNRINVGISYAFFPGFNAEIRYSYENTNSSGANLYNQSTYYARNLINKYTQSADNGILSYPIPVGAILQTNSIILNAQHLRGQLNYNKDWGPKGSFKAIIGSEWSSAISDYATPPPAYGYNPDTKTQYTNINYSESYALNPLQLAFSQIPNFSDLRKMNDRFVSYFSNASYIYANRYTVSASARIDKSNLFGVNTNQKDVPLYSVGGAWELSKEKFYQSGIIPNLKFRATFGYNGNINKTSTAMTTLSQLSNSYYSGNPYNTIANPGNPDLKWEKDRILNFGVDFSLKNRIVSGSVEAYFKKAENLYGQQILPPSSGMSSFYGNVAGTSGHGFEVTLNTKDIAVGNFSWNSSFNYNYVIDKVTKYDYSFSAKSFAGNNGSNLGTIVPLVGKPVFAIYSYRSGPLTHSTGDPQGYLNGQLSTDYAAIINATTIGDLVYNGPSRPTSFGNFRNNFSYKTLTLSLNVIYKLNYVFRKSSIDYQGLFNGWIGNADFARRWQRPGDESVTTIPSLPNASYDLNRDSFYGYSENLIENGSHIRLQDISVSYDLIRVLPKSSPFASLSVYSYVNNVGILWRANRDHLDPDVLVGYSSTSLPLPRTYAIGVKANLK